MNRKKNQGFTLIEIAIVLVIIGLLLGGILKGQELITSARVRNMISQQDGVKAAFFGFQDRFRALPGDYTTASINLKCQATCLNGNGNGQIEASAIPVSGSEVHEELLSWTHLTAANFLNGHYNMTAGDAAATDANSPKNPYSIYMQLVYDANYADSGTPVNKHNLKTGNQVPVEILAEQLCRTAFLPRPQAADRSHGRFSQSCIFLKQMSAEDPTEMVQCQGPLPPWLPNVGKNALGQLGEDEIFFVERETVGFNGPNPKICRDIVQDLARNMKQYVVEGTADPAAGLRVKVDDIGPECWHVGHGYVLVVQPQLIVADRQGLDGYRDEQRGNARDFRDSVRQALRRFQARNGK